MSQNEELNRLAEAAQGRNWRAGNYDAKSFIPSYQVIAETDEGLCVVLEGNKNFIPEAEANCAFAAAANPVVVKALIAENAGLKTGYEAYERVNAELKAENETLVAAAQALRDEWRKDRADADRHRFARDCAYGALTLMEGKRVFVELDYPPGEFSGCDQAYEAAIDAAMGKGGQP
ncbi:hypothetical protein HX776_24805 [Pseudomonas agarici]|uniref:hypothetical protein n=1 Tax=Pseudomonas agarici TaxID=46677 RepID=UPI0002DD5515|nr:hypothetical protein [Pseudomonas agarici]NWC12010.1 hypothetical protein [Pseudomonas agarici]